MRAAESGAALLEALAALAILGTSALALAAHARQTLATTEMLRAAESDVAEAGAFLDAVVLWPVADLDRRLGERRNGPWRLEIVRDPLQLYHVTVRDSAGRRVLVATTLYRPGGQDGG